MPLYGISIGFRDEDNDTATMQWYVNAVDEAAAIARANALAALLDDISGGAVTTLQITQNLPLTGLRATPVAGVDIEKGIRLIFGTDFSGVNPFVTVPGVMLQGATLPLIIPPGVLNPDAPEWDALFTEVFVTGDYEDYRGADLLNLRDNYETFNGKRRG